MAVVAILDFGKMGQKLDWYKILIFFKRDSDYESDNKYLAGRNL